MQLRKAYTIACMDKKKRAQVRSIIRQKNKHKWWMRGGRRVKKLRGKEREKER